MNLLFPEIIRRSKPSARRGAVLILVVALLVLLALVATAFLTTTRFDRQAAGQHVSNTQMEFAFEAGKKYLEAEVLSDILDPGALQANGATTVRTPSSIVTPSAYRPIDAALTDSLLAPRIPFLQFTYPLTMTGGPNPIARPMWRTVSWPTFTSAERSLGIQYEPPDNNWLVQPAIPVASVTPDIGPVDLVRPYENGVTYKMGEVVMVAGEAAGSADYYIRTNVNLGTPSNAAFDKPSRGQLLFPGANPIWEKCDPKQYFTFAPTTVVGADGKTYPAFYVYNNYLADRWRGGWNAGTDAKYVTGPILAADADGDGVADSMYRKMPLGTLNGLTYYMAVRVIDNGSAVNLNTAWSSLTDFDLNNAGNPNLPRLGSVPNYGIFPGNIGLREMLFTYNAPNQIGEPLSLYSGVTGNVNDVADLPTEYYTRDTNIAAPEFKAIREISQLNIARFGMNLTQPYTRSLSLDPVNDDSTFRADFVFRTQTEALYTHAVRRPQNTGTLNNNDGAPDANIDADDHKLGWFTLSGDGAALAFKGGVFINLNASPSGIEQLFIDGVKDLSGNVDITDPEIDSIYKSAANRNPGTSAGGGNEFTGFSNYPLGAANSVTGVNPNIDRWFDFNFNFDRYYENGRFINEPVGGRPLFHSVRPLLTTSSAVSNVVGPRTTVTGRAEVPEQVADSTNAVANANYTMTTSIPAAAGGRNFIVDAVTYAGDNEPVSNTGQAQAQLGPSVGTFSSMRQYREPAREAASVASTTIPKVSANTAEFGDLWRAYWNVMADDWSTVPAYTATSTVPTTNYDTGSPFDREIQAYESGPGGAIFNPYHGSRFDSSAGTTNFPASTIATTPDANGQVPATAVPQVPFVSPPAELPAGSLELEYHPARMFRSPIRSFVLNRGGGPINMNASDFVPPLPQPAVGAITYNPAVSLPRLRPDQMILLRSAIAAVNAEDLRDPDFRVTRRTIRLKLSGQTYRLTGAPGIEVDPYVAVTINGYEPQPFITEVFAHTSEQHANGSGAANAATGYVAIELHNPYSFPIDIRYCKIATINRYDEGQNGYPGLRVLDTEEEAPALAERIILSTAESNLNPGVGLAGEQYIRPTVIPPNGYLVLENYSATAPGAPGSAASRPESAGFNSAITSAADGQGSISVAAGGPRMNVAYVANLHRILNREFILLRPLDVDTERTAASDPSDPHWAGVATDDTYNDVDVFPLNGFVRLVMQSAGVTPADSEDGTVRTLMYRDPIINTGGTNRGQRAPRTAAVDMVPLDSFDFTGLTLPNDTDNNRIPVNAQMTGNATAWHYVRANESFTNATPSSLGNAAWRFVYPGRYDASKYAARVAPQIPLARQQGTREVLPAGDAAAGTLWDTGGVPAPAPNLGRPDASGTSAYTLSLTVPFRRGEFAIPLQARGFPPLGIAPIVATGYFPAIATGLDLASTSNPLKLLTAAQAAELPFGGFARNGDLLEVPFIGSYRIQYPTHIGSTATVNDPTRPVGVLDTFPIRNLVIELNSITMDAAMAEDTDVNDDPIVGPDIFNQRDNGSQSREQIGRFVPLRKTSMPFESTINGNDPSMTSEQADYNTHVDWAVLPTAPIPVLYDDGAPNVYKGPARTTATGYDLTNLNRYRWAADLFDYLTVQSASDDFLPNIKPDLSATASTVKNTIGGTANSQSEVNVPIEGMININTASERVLAMVPWCPDVPIDNLVGDRFTFGVVPGVAGFQEVTGGADQINDNLQMARAIVRFRDGFEARNPDYLALPGYDARDNAPSAGTYRSQPFLTTWDLYRVPEFRSLQSLLLNREPAAGNFAASLRGFLDDRVGDITPFPHVLNSGQFVGKFFGVGDRVRDAINGQVYECILSFKGAGNLPSSDTAHWRTAIPAVGATAPGLSRAFYDYEEQSLMLTRVSNLITTRSDVFTAYMLLEGWENAGTPKASLKVSRRAAFFLDRSQTTPGKIEMKAAIPISVD